ncbi:MAG: Lumazine-binding protein [Cyanobacteria bacterium P01_H01_bin.35]
MSIKVSQYLNVTHLKMFTGIIQQTGKTYQINPEGSGCELIIDVSPSLYAEVEIKSNISINGRALTILAKETSGELYLLKFYLGSTKVPAQYQDQKKLNLERSIRLGEEISGPLFYGVPSGYCQLISRENLLGGGIKIEVNWESEFFQYLDIKDQVCLDGVLLIIKELGKSSLLFDIYPETVNLTNLAEKKIGEDFAIEIDPMVKKIGQILAKKILS